MSQFKQDLKQKSESLILTLMGTATPESLPLPIKSLLPIFRHKIPDLIGEAIDGKTDEELLTLIGSIETECRMIRESAGR